MTESTGAPKRVRLRKQSRLVRLLLVAGAILVALLIAEVALRVSGFSYFNTYVADQDVGYSLRPGAEGWWKKEGLTYVKINSQGFHDREHTLAKPPGTLRIAVVGDSFTEALQVPLENAFWSVMEPKLQECLQRASSKVEVLSFGVGGFSTAQELVLLQKRVWQFSPDVVVLLVTTGNDVRDNSRALNVYRDQPIPYFVFQNGALVLDDSLLTARNHSLKFRLQQSFPGRLFYRLQNNLRLLGLFYTIRESYRASSEKSDRRGQQTGLRIEPGLDNEVFGNPTTPDWNDAWKLTEGLILKIRDEVRAKGAKFLVVTGSMGVQVYPDAEARREYMNSLGVSNLFSPDYRIKALGERNGFRVLNLAPALADYATRNRVFLHGVGEGQGRGHWNVTGHRLAGELIAQELCSQAQADEIPVTIKQYAHER